MRAPITAVLGLLLGVVACFPKDTPKTAALSEEDLSRDRRWGRSSYST